MYSDSIIKREAGGRQRSLPGQQGNKKLKISLKSEEITVIKILPNCF